MQTNTIYFSSLLNRAAKSGEKSRFYSIYGDERAETILAVADELFAVMGSLEVPIAFIDNTSDIWVRDCMPVRTKSKKYVSFKYDPWYLENEPELITDFERYISTQFPGLDITYSDINLDGGNVVFSPSREKVIISERIFEENDERDEEEIVHCLERLLEADVIMIPSFDRYEDIVGQASSLARFVDEDTVVINRIRYKDGTEPENELEQEMEEELDEYGIAVKYLPYFNANEDFEYPYFSTDESAVGCYINYLETENYIILPQFLAENDAGVAPESDFEFVKNMDEYAYEAASRIFSKKVVPLNAGEIAKHGGVLNCISWEL